MTEQEAAMRQARELVRAALMRDPARRHSTASDYVMRALGKAWPCPKTEGENN